MFNFFSKRHDPIKLWFATDIHCHVIPGIDDGSKDAETSVRLIEHMQSWGIDRIIATPHVTQETFENTPDSIGSALSLLRDALSRRGNDINISNSAEYRLDELFVKHLEKGILMPYPNDYILVENSFIQEPWNLDQILFDLKVRNLKPILAHPERYHYYYSKPTRYKVLHDAGTFFQINLLSLAGHYGRDEKRMAEYLIENNMVDFIGTDLHGDHHVNSIEQYLSTKDAERHCKKLSGTVKNDIVFN